MCVCVSVYLSLTQSDDGREVVLVMSLCVGVWGCGVWLCVFVRWLVGFVVVGCFVFGVLGVWLVLCLGFGVSVGFGCVGGCF